MCNGGDALDISPTVIDSEAIVDGLIAMREMSALWARKNGKFFDATF
jgi:hypothetical protein